MADSDDELFDPHEAIGRIEADSDLRDRILAEAWFPSKKMKGTRARKGRHVTWIAEDDAKLLKVEPDQVIATQGNIFSAAKLGTFAKMMRQGEIPYALMPHGYLDKVTQTDIEETQEARHDDLLYDGMTRPFVDDDLGKTIVRLNSGNHRAFAAFMAGEPHIWVALIDRRNPRRSNPARKAAVDAADAVVAWAGRGDRDYIANVTEAQLARFEKDSNAPLVERPFRGLDAITQISQKDLERYAGMNVLGWPPASASVRPSARASAISIARAYGDAFQISQHPESIGLIAQMIELALRRQPPSGRVVQWALDVINEKRRQRHERPLDPVRAGWTDDDILAEAKRLQQNPRMSKRQAKARLAEVEAELVKVRDVIDAAYWRFTRQARAKPPVLAEPESHVRLKQLLEEQRELKSIVSAPSTARTSNPPSVADTKARLLAW